MMAPLATLRGGMQPFGLCFSSLPSSSAVQGLSSGWRSRHELPLTLVRGFAQAERVAEPTEEHNQLPVAPVPAFNADQIPLRTGRPRLVMLGTGWASARLLRDINPKAYDLTVISPRNHMVFTPLLASTAVGTLEGRSVAVHMTNIQKALFQPQNGLFIAEATAVIPERKVVECKSEDGLRFYVPYDKLAICTGSQGSTFGIPGVLEHAHFLRDVSHAEKIRQKIMGNLAQAGVPGRSMAEYHRLLHIIIVGGGPTGVEAAGELMDFINQDLKKSYPERARAMAVTLIEAKELLGSFDARLREYAARKLSRQGVQLRKGVVKRLNAHDIELMDGTVIPYGLCIWSTGVGPTPFTLSLPFAKTKVGRLSVDGHLRVLAPSPTGQAPSGEKIGMLTAESDTKSTAALEPVPGVYALGDCCANPQNPLPALAQVAEQQGAYLARLLNAEAKALHDAEHPREGTPKPAPKAATDGTGGKATFDDDFKYVSLGSMASVGGASAILELGKAQRRLSMAGFVSWLAWRSAYLTRLGSWPKRLSVMFEWTMTLLFGRDMSRW